MSASSTQKCVVFKVYLIFYLFFVVSIYASSSTPKNTLKFKLLRRIKNKEPAVLPPPNLSIDNNDKNIVSPIDSGERNILSQADNLLDNSLSKPFLPLIDIEPVIQVENKASVDFDSPINLVEDVCENKVNKYECDDDLELLMMEGASILEKKNQPKKDNNAYEKPQKSFELEEPNETPLFTTAVDKNYIHSGVDMEDDTTKEIVTLLNARLGARLYRDFDKADKIRLELEEKFGVSLFDRRGEWRDKEGRSGIYTTNPKAPKVETYTACTISYEDAMQLISQRTQARRIRSFKEADEIRYKLADNGIEVCDRLNSWKAVDGSMSGEQSSDMEEYFQKAAESKWQKWTEE